MLREEVTLKDGHIKTVVADSKEELAEGVAAVKTDSAPVSPDLHNPKEPNAVVSPDNAHTEPAYVQPPDPELPQEEVEEKAPPKKKSKK